jgi:hypothetical protein
LLWQEEGTGTAVVNAHPASTSSSTNAHPVPPQIVTNA